MMISKAASYDYPADGSYNETVATLDDGRTAWVNTQYATVSVRHAPECARREQTACYPVIECTCGAMADVDVDGLVADARAHGKLGCAPSTEMALAEVERNVGEIEEMELARTRNGLCPNCQSYCDGDCGAQ